MKLQIVQLIFFVKMFLCWILPSLLIDITDSHPRDKPISHDVVKNEIQLLDGPGLHQDGVDTLAIGNSLRQVHRRSEFLVAVHFAIGLEASGCVWND